MERYSFFDAVLNPDGTYDRVYDSADVASYFASFIGNGVYPAPANSLMVSAGAGMNVSVAVGKAWINGYFYELADEPKTLSLALGNGTNPRIDLVVLSLNMSKRLIELKVIKGASAINPQEPKISRTKDIYDLVLAKVNVPAGTTVLHQNMIADTRFDKDKCGIVSGVVNQIDTTGLFTQYNDAFTSWFESVKGVMDGDVATNLTARMVEVETKADKAVKDADEAKNRIVPIEKGGTGAPTGGMALKNLGCDAHIVKRYKVGSIVDGLQPMSKSQEEAKWIITEYSDGSMEMQGRYYPEIPCQTPYSSNGWHYSDSVVISLPETFLIPPSFVASTCALGFIAQDNGVQEQGKIGFYAMRPGAGSVKGVDIRIWGWKYNRQVN